jgi:N,N-dimethylformamidase
LEEFLGRGGRLMYMGGNGFYWRIAFHPENAAIIELRRAEGRGRAWDADPGEYYHSFTGEYGGLWRLLGRAPNRLTGVGFAALAHEGSTSYRRQPGACDPRASFIFAGTSEGDFFGGYGSVCGGAVSQEIDRANPLLGTPAHTLILASSENHPPDFMLAREEDDACYPESRDARLRADMTFFETPAGGAVFSTGSIGFSGALSHRGYDNDICRIATNVVERLSDATPFVHPAPA